ncbi:hypothetical protein MGYG_06449 [Nannizzia gypsea CBS 118893]|uniref:Uncharacterized protein n=1 Tax=Arthroderma gypseum (strain ATCC MYA-4604 / CBS 118893) TaxID=535722 RepID=E4UZC1_ARTGP|nr:hypothetical protein MGYG_06449 [Nannizzia gypsea CBS 118893]EFR03451.1 hypothetical protein MGYG_06449 [Nannizzia gypsea CBS 118893]
MDESKLGWLSSGDVDVEKTCGGGVRLLGAVVSFAQLGNVMFPAPPAIFLLFQRQLFISSRASNSQQHQQTLPLQVFPCTESALRCIYLCKLGCREIHLVISELTPGFDLSGSDTLLVTESSTPGMSPGANTGGDETWVDGYQS